MQKVGEQMQLEVKQLTEIVAQYDINLCTKANKQELFDVDNKFRKFIKKDKYKAFVETTELEAHETKTELNSVVEDVALIKKNMIADIHTVVRKLTSHLKVPPQEGINPGTVDVLMVQAHAELNKPGSPTKKRLDENASIKEHLIDKLNKKAELSDLQ